MTRAKREGSLLSSTIVRGVLLFFYVILLPAHVPEMKPSKLRPREKKGVRLQATGLASPNIARPSP